MNNTQKLQVATDALERLCTHSVRSSKQIDDDWDNARATLAMLSLIAAPSTGRDLQAELNDVIGAAKQAGFADINALKAHKPAAPSTEQQAEHPDTRHLGGLLARIHRDGGQHQLAVGTEQAVVEADFIVAKLNADSDERAATQAAPAGDAVAVLRGALEKMRDTTYEAGMPESVWGIAGQAIETYERAAIQDADELRFNAQRLRNVAKLAGIEAAGDDAMVDSCRGAILGSIAAALRQRAATQPAGDVVRYIGDSISTQYSDVGVAKGAGTMRGNLFHVYRDPATDQLYARTPADFAARMERIGTLEERLAAPSGSTEQPAAAIGGFQHPAIAKPLEPFRQYLADCGTEQPAAPDCEACGDEGMVWVDGCTEACSLCQDITDDSAEQLPPVQPAAASVSASSERSVGYLMAATQTFADEWAAQEGNFGRRVQALSTKARIQRMLEDDAIRLAAAEKERDDLRAQLALKKADCSKWMALVEAAHQLEASRAKRAQLARPADLSGLHEAASDFLKYIEAHDFGGIPDGETAERLRQALLAAKRGPAHETIVADGGTLTCTACGTTAAAQEPVAWMHDTEGRVDVIHDEVKALWLKVGQPNGFYREKVPCKVEHYTIPLYAAPQPAAKADAPAVAVDLVVEANRALLLNRSNVGIRKYGVTLSDARLSERDLLVHALEESLDLANYLQANIQRADAERDAAGAAEVAP